MIAAINARKIAEISNLDSGIYRARSSRSMSNSDVVAPLGNTGEIADSKFSHHAVLHAGENF
jgi:hypothetical protein